MVSWKTLRKRKLVQRAAAYAWVSPQGLCLVGQEFDWSPLTAVEPMFAGLHHDPRWPPFLSAIGKAPGRLAKLDFKVALPH